MTYQQYLILLVIFIDYLFQFTIDYILLATDFDQIMTFVRSSNLRLMLNLNQVDGNGNSWNTSNLVSLLDYASYRQYDMDFELGNGIVVKLFA